MSFSLENCVTDKCREPGVAYLSDEQVNLLRVAERSWDLLEAKYFSEAFALQPGEQVFGMVPFPRSGSSETRCYLFIARVYSIG